MRRAGCVMACALVLASCSARRVVLTTDGGYEPVRSCAEALLNPSEGSPCAFGEACVEVMDECCERVLRCEGGVLRAGDRECDPECMPCGSDRVCPSGRVCEGTCQPCPEIADCEGPAGWVRLTRNGCPTCDFAPRPSECVDRTHCPELDCYFGSVCAMGCTAPERCCVNVCAEPGCPPLAPLGCVADCPPGVDCPLCSTTHCQCADGEWVCRVECVDPPVARASCFYP